MRKLFLLLGIIVMAEVDAFEYNCSFSCGKWDPADFIMVKGPRWNRIGSWLQEADHIVQNVPASVSEKDLHERMHSEAYTAMCLGKKIKLHKTASCSSVMSFDYRMAPLIVIAPELGKNEEFNVPEFREHWEIVLYDQGINVWHHFWNGGKPSWVKHSYLLAPYHKLTRYELKATVIATDKGQMLEVECDGRKFGCHLPGLGEEFYFGVIGCEGRNRFYDFKVSAPGAK